MRRWGEPHERKTRNKSSAVREDGGRWREEEKAGERAIGGVSKRVKYTVRGELLSESGGQTRSCHLISGRDITAHFSFLVRYQSSGFSSGTVEKSSY